MSAAYSTCFCTSSTAPESALKHRLTSQPQRLSRQASLCHCFGASCNMYFALPEMLKYKYILNHLSIDIVSLLLLLFINHLLLYEITAT